MSRRAPQVFIIIVVLCAFAADGFARQSPPRSSSTNYLGNSLLLAGYATRLPKQPFGVFACWTSAISRSDSTLSKPDLGLYFAFLIGPRYISSDYKFTESYVQDALGHRRIDTGEEWISFQLGINNTRTEHVVYYGGLGITIYNGYYRYRDPNGLMGRAGKYWIPDGEGASVMVDVFMGLIIRISHGFIANVGAGFQPAGMVLGFGFDPDML